MRRTRYHDGARVGLVIAGVVLFTVLTIVATAAAVIATVGSFPNGASRGAPAALTLLERPTARQVLADLIVKKADIESHVADMLAPSLGSRPAAVSCAGDLENPGVGTTTRCKVQLSDGRSAGATVTVTTVADGGVGVSVKVDSLTVFQDELETMAADYLERNTGSRPTAVSCPGDLSNPTVGTKTHCTATDSNGTSSGGTVAVNNVAGLQVGINVQVDGAS
ncbi:MAG TPA: hypothetical protein VH008_26425 [Pseudonocardia sp.]|jgi:hypothetical protein|nr:hypothetical protein [Pseudonocardia sp.]